MKKIYLRLLYSFYWLSLLLVLSLFFHCKKEDPISINAPNVIEQSFPIVYEAELPAGKLPYPHHNPEYSQQSYDSLVQNLFIINNFGLYQCGDTNEECYFHDGLDFVLENGTPIFALEAGTIRANIGGSPFYRTLVVEDDDEPGYAWTYTHIYNFVVAPGDKVSQGQYLAEVNFQGLDHIHLNRTRLREGGSWSSFGDLINIYPDDYFTFIDITPPIIKPPFHFFPNASDSPFTSEGIIDTISGEVDIVVSMRDAGAYAGDFIGNSGYWGDRLAVRDISYRILKDGVEILNKPSFDFTKLEFVFHAEKWRETMTVYKHLNVLNLDAGNNNMFHSHYIITNARDSLQGRIDPMDEALSWNTQELDSLGQARYPNGLYQVEVTAHDSNGNESIEIDEVYIEN